jgi:hypothetical protein
LIDILSDHRFASVEDIRILIIASNDKFYDVCGYGQEHQEVAEEFMYKHALVFFQLVFLRRKRYLPKHLSLFINFPGSRITGVVGRRRKDTQQW